MTFDSDTRSQRLFGAADQLCKAMESSEGMNALLTLQPDDLCVETAAPSQSYTLIELIHAMGWLIQIDAVPAQ